MSKFSDLLKQPLPSKITKEDGILLKSFDESYDDEDIIDASDDVDSMDTDEIDLSDVVNQIPENEDEIEDEIANINDEDLDDLDDDDEEDDTDEEDEGEEEPENKEVNLTSDEEVEADKFMMLAATPVALKSELTESECKKFAESVDMDIAIDEGFFIESDRDMFALLENADLDMLSDDDVFTEATKFAPKTKVVFSLKDRIHQLYEIALYACARSHNDKDYWVIQKCQRIERQRKEKIRKKYKAEARKRVKVYIARLKGSKSGVLSKIADKFTSKKEK